MTQAVVVQTDDREKIQLVKDTIAREQNLTDNELRLLMYTASRLGLDPLAKQIYAVRRKGKIVIQTGIDGFRSIAARTGEYAGSDDAVFDDEKLPRKATVTVWRIVQGQRCPFSASARWDQYYPGKELGFMWEKMPHVMLGKCAEGLALRKAFPAHLSGVYTDEEMAQAGTPDQESGRGRSSTGRTNDAPVAPPPAPVVTQDLSQFPPQLGGPEEALPFEPLTRDQPCPLAPKEMPLAKMSKKQLAYFEDWLTGNYQAPRAEEWMELVKAELATR